MKLKIHGVGPWHTWTWMVRKQQAVSWASSVSYKESYQISIHYLHFKLDPLRTWPLNITYKHVPSLNTTRCSIAQSSSRAPDSAWHHWHSGPALFTSTWKRNVRGSGGMGRKTATYRVWMKGREWVSICFKAAHGMEACWKMKPWVAHRAKITRV